ncbi:MAG: hypothetical protein FVQ79_04495 [Planctomycetes bacterium]|nr:hypothetical protein [Planctomycetota bacterium]
MLKNLLCGILFVTVFFVFVPITYSGAESNRHFKGAFLPLVDHDEVNFGDFFDRPESPTIRIVTVDKLSNVGNLAASGEVDVIFVMCPVAAEVMFSMPGFELGESFKSEVKGLAANVRARSLAHGGSLSGGEDGVPDKTIIERSAEISESLQKVIDARLKILGKYAEDAFIVNAVKKANSQKLSLDEIKKLDLKWISGAESDFVNTVLGSDVSRLLRKKVRSNKLLYTEAFLCDNQGATVGTYPRTSDYWQGDEEKFTRCFKDGDGEIFVGPLEFDESTGSRSVQISVPVKDDGKTIGVLVVGLRNIK